MTGRHDDGPATRTPRWLLVLGVLLALLALLIVAALLFGGGEHGPGRHMSAVEAVPSVLWM